MKLNSATLCMLAQMKGQRPLYDPRERDFSCSVCGEPWDAYGVRLSLNGSPAGDMTKEEAEKFIQGKGCPSCPKR